MIQARALWISGRSIYGAMTLITHLHQHKKAAPKGGFFVISGPIGGASRSALLRPGIALCFGFQHCAFLYCLFMSGLELAVIRMHVSTAEFSRKLHQLTRAIISPRCERRSSRPRNRLRAVARVLADVVAGSNYHERLLASYRHVPLIRPSEWATALAEQDAGGSCGNTGPVQDLRPQRILASHMRLTARAGRVEPGARLDVHALRCRRQILR